MSATNSSCWNYYLAVTVKAFTILAKNANAYLNQVALVVSLMHLSAVTAQWFMGRGIITLNFNGASFQEEQSSGPTDAVAFRKSHVY